MMQIIYFLVIFQSENHTFPDTVGGNVLTLSIILTLHIGDAGLKRNTHLSTYMMQV